MSASVTADGYKDDYEYWQKKQNKHHQSCIDWPWKYPGICYTDFNLIDISSNLSPEKLHPWLAWRKWRRRPPVVDRWSGGAWSLEWCLLYQHDAPCWPQRTPVHACHHETPAKQISNLIKSYPAKSTVLLRKMKHIVRIIWLFALAFLHPHYEKSRLIIIIFWKSLMLTNAAFSQSKYSKNSNIVKYYYRFTGFYLDFRTLMSFFKTLNKTLKSHYL